MGQVFGRSLLAVYCGDGRYVQRHQHGGHDEQKNLKVGREPSPMVRSDAVAACHAARAAGLRAWLVQAAV